MKGILILMNDIQFSKLLVKMKKNYFIKYKFIYLNSIVILIHNLLILGVSPDRFNQF